MSDKTPLTPLQLAPKWFNSLRRRRRSLSGADQFRYFFSRQYRNYVKRWESSGKSDLLEDRQKSIDQTAEYIGKWNRFIVWMENNVRPNEARFESVRGTSVDNTAVSVGHGATSRARDMYDSDVRAYDFFLGKVRGVVDGVGDELDLAILDDDILGNLVDEVHAAGVGLGLEPHPQWVDAHDGAVWFVNPETQDTYFVALGLFDRMGDVTYSFRARQNPDPRWVNYGLADLTHTAIDIIKPVTLSNPTRCFRDYFGYFNSALRPYMEAAEQDPPVEWE